MNDIAEKIRKIILDNLEESYEIKDEIKGDENYIEKYSVDSIAIMQIIIDIEDVFDIEFDIDDIEIDIISKIDNIEKIIIKKQGRQ